MKRFLTEYHKAGVLYGGEVDALDIAHAQQICDGRDQGETVVGTLYAMIPATRAFGHQQADSMAQAFAESGDDEPPDASAFGPIASEAQP